MVVFTRQNESLMVSKICFNLLGCLAFCALLAGCSKNDPYKFLPGEWEVTSGSVDGKNVTASGHIVFKGDRTGNMGLIYLVDSLQVTTTGTFQFTASESMIVFNAQSPDQFVWDRKVDKRKEQAFEFIDEVEGSDHTVSLSFEKQ